MRGISSLGLTLIIFLALGSIVAIYIVVQSLPETSRAAETSTETQTPRIMYISENTDPSKIPNGVYMLVGDVFIPLNISGAYMPKDPGYYFIYFHNDECPHCQAFYPRWISYLRSGGGVFRNITVIEVVCNWFTERCSSDAARSTFAEYNVVKSPTFLLIKVGLGGRIENMWDVGDEYARLQNSGVIPAGQEYMPQYLEAIVRSKMAG